MIDRGSRVAAVAPPSALTSWAVSARNGAAIGVRIANLVLMPEDPVFVDDVTPMAHDELLTRDWGWVAPVVPSLSAVDDIRRRGNELESVCRLSRLGATCGTVK